MPQTPAHDASPWSSEALVALDRARMAQELLRGIAHDLRNHLQVIALGAALGDADVEGRVEQSIDDMGELLHLLGQLGRHGTDEPPFTDLTGALRLIERMAGFQRNAPAAPLQLRMPTATARVAIPEPVLAHATLNLILNAKEASGKDETPVRIGAAVGDGEVEIAIDDHGPGAPANAGAPFVTTKADGRHAGLGVFAARWAIERHGGTLSLEPRAGGGTRARIVLPRLDEPNDRG